MERHLYPIGAERVLVTPGLPAPAGIGKMAALLTYGPRSARGRAATAALLAVAGLLLTAPPGFGAPSLQTDRGCYLVGQRVGLRGAGFAAARPFRVSIDGVFFGQSTTDAQGAFNTSLRPGGLAAGIAQHVDHLDATDGSVDARATFTVTRPPGGRFLASSGNPSTLSAPFEVWGFARDGRRRTVYLHYVTPAGRVARTLALGQTSGQCGSLRTRRRHVFPFAPSLGAWTLQLDTRARYSRRVTAPVARIGVQIRVAA